MKTRPLLTQQRFIQFYLWFAGIAAILILISIATGDFVPLQTSEVTQIGVCTQQSTLTMEKIVPLDVETLYICGELAGETKRSFSIIMFYEDQHILSTSKNWPSGVFFVPVKAAELKGLETSVFLAGTYKVGVRYERPIALETTFQVAEN